MRSQVTEPSINESVPEADVKPVQLLPDAATVLAVNHWNENLFSFSVERPDSLRFRSGEFLMLGLMGDPDATTGKQRPLLRAYSIASPSWNDELEFYSIKVPDGPLTSKLQHIQPGQQIILRPKPVGTLILDALLPGKRLWLFATGTGIAPFASLVRDPETYERFDQVIVMHTCREVAELEYGRRLITELPDHEILGEIVAGKIDYYPTTTQEASLFTGRITDNLRSGKVYNDLAIPPLDVVTDRCMICGSLGFNTDIMSILTDAGFSEGTNSNPSSFVIEKAFVD